MLIQGAPEISELKVIRQLDGLAKLSVNQKESWQTEEEIIKLFSKQD